MINRFTSPQEDLEAEAVKIFRLVVAEWRSDPMSAQCFDLRVVKRALEIDAKLAAIWDQYRTPPRPDAGKET